MTDFRANISAAWQQVRDDDAQMGRDAYPAYAATLRGLATHYASPYIPTVEAFVALSPNNDYHGNLRSLVSLLVARENWQTFEDCTISTYRACGARAWGYLMGEVSFSDTVKGRKIISFRDNILYQEASKRVTVDGHMIAIACGNNMTMSEANLRLRERGLYDAVEGAVVSIARREKAAPCAIQAALWTWRKRTQAIKFDGQVDLFTGATRWDRPLTPDEILPYEKAK